MQANEFSRKTPSLEDEGIDLVELFRVLFARKILISSITLIFAIGALVYFTFFSTPIYKATATIQVKESDFFEHKINLLTSRHVIGEVVDTLKPHIVGKPKLVFAVGDRLYRDHELSTDGAPALEKLNTFRYSWSGGQIELVNLEVPDHLIDKPLTLRLKESNQIVLQRNKNILLQGKVGEELSANGVVLNVQSFSALPGTEFTIIRKDRLQTIIDTKDNIEVSEIESGIFSLSYESKNLQMATAMLDQVIKVHMRQHTDSNLAEVQEELDLINNKMPELEKLLIEARQNFDDRVMQYESTDLNKSVIANLNPQILSGIEQSLRNLKLRRIELSHRMKTDAVDQLSVIDYAVVDPLDPVKIRKSSLFALITLLGFGVACAYVLIVRVIHCGLEDPSEVEAIGIPVYATIPYSEKLPKNSKIKVDKRKSSGRDLLAVDYPTDFSVEALRVLRTSLHFAMSDAKNNVIAILGPSHGIGKSFVSANLGAVIAQGGKKVLLIDGDMRCGDLQDHLGMSFDAGLTDYLSGQYALEEVISATVVEGLDILPRGAVVPNPAELLMHPRYSELIRYVSETYDLVIVDTPPVLAVTDPVIIASHAGTTLLVARYGITHKKELEITQQRFEQNGVSIQGVVFNGIQRNGSKSYGHYGYYAYEYTHSNES